jgi:hypothetical protein
LFSLSSWLEQLENAMSVLDKVFSRKPSRTDFAEMIIQALPWEAAVSVIGNLLELETDLTPVRYRASQFPSKDQLARLRPLAL